MTHLQGTVGKGANLFEPLMKAAHDKFRGATGADLFPGTLNVRISHSTPIEAKFWVKSEDVEGGKRNVDYAIEPCLINGYSAFRVRPVNRDHGRGGHCDHIFEIVADCQLRTKFDLKDGDSVIITLERDV